jgi:hypothetical protein
MLSLPDSMTQGPAMIKNGPFSSILNFPHILCYPSLLHGIMNSSSRDVPHKIGMV